MSIILNYSNALHCTTFKPAFASLVIRPHTSPCVPQNLIDTRGTPRVPHTYKNLSSPAANHIFWLHPGRPLATTTFPYGAHFTQHNKSH